MPRKKWKFAQQLGLIRLADEGGEGGGSSQEDGSNDDGAGGAGDQNDDGSQQSQDDAGGRQAPWDEENFDAKRAAKLLANLDADLKKAQSERDTYKQKHDEAENAKLSDLQRAEKERDDNATKASDLELENARLKALITHGLDEDDLEFIGGKTPEEIEKRAAKYAERHGKDRSDGPPTQRPKGRLRGGGDPTNEPDETDPRKLAAQVPRQ